MPLTRWFLLATTMLLIQQPALAKECIGVISAGSGNHFWRAVESGARKAGSEFGYEIFYRTPPNESAIKEQGQQLTDAIKGGCVAIVLAPNSPTPQLESQKSKRLIVNTRQWSSSIVICSSSLFMPKS